MNSRMQRCRLWHGTTEISQNLRGRFQPDYRFGFAFAGTSFLRRSMSALRCLIVSGAEATFLSTLSRAFSLSSVDRGPPA